LPLAVGREADFASSFGYAYTNLRDDYAVLSPLVCEGALGVGTAAVQDWKQALGVLVLVHESFYLRRWRWRRHEGKVECRAEVYFREAAVRQGASVEHANDLYTYAYAIALHAYKDLPAVPRRSVPATRLETTRVTVAAGRAAHTATACDCVLS
jgi:hypothetical protein